MIKIQLETSNDAFQYGREEAANILLMISAKLSAGHNEGSIQDSNGNTIGQWSYTEEVTDNE